MLKLKKYFKLIIIYAAVIIGVLGWAWGLNQSYFASKYQEIEIQQLITDLESKDVKQDLSLTHIDELFIQNTKEHAEINSKLCILESTTTDIQKRMMRLEDFLINKKSMQLGLNNPSTPSTPSTPISN